MPSSSEAIDAVPMVVDTTPPRFGIVGFYVVAVLFNLCLVGQLLTVGVAYFANPDWWQVHRWLVRGYGGLSLILVVWAYRVTFPRRIRILTVTLPGLLGIQFLTIYGHLPFLPLPLAIVHPLVGFLLVSVSSTLVHRTWRLVAPRETAAIQAM